MKLKLKETKEEAKNVISFILEPQEPLSWRAGQFLHYVLHHEPTDQRGSDRWFTVSAAPSEGHVMITTRKDEERISSFKNALFSMKAGDEIEISDVDGDLTVEDTTREYIFIAGGIGVTPFRAILKEAENQGQKLRVTLLYANRDDDIPFKAELDALAGLNPDLKIHYFSGQRIDEAAIRAVVSDISTPLFYVSGPEPMVDAFGSMLKEMGVTKENLKQDWFPGYKAEI